MEDKKKTRTWLIVLSAVVAVAVIAGVVLGIVVLTSNNNKITTQETAVTPTEPTTPTQPAQPASLGPAWPTMVAFYTDLQHGDYAGAYALMTQGDRDSYGSLAAFQSAMSGTSFDPANTTLVSETNDGQKAVLTTRNGRGEVAITPCYNEDGSWRIEFEEGTTP